jgi:hypothetical protein
LPTSWTLSILKAIAFWMDNWEWTMDNYQLFTINY